MEADTAKSSQQELAAKLEEMQTQLTKANEAGEVVSNELKQLKESRREKFNEKVAECENLKTQLVEAKKNAQGKAKQQKCFRQQKLKIVIIYRI